MAPLIVMLVIWVGVRVIGFTGCGPGELIAWALRAALAGMFLFTAVSHFHRERGRIWFKWCRRPSRNRQFW